MMNNIEQVLASKRKWRSIEQNLKRKYDSRALRQINKALHDKKLDPPPSDFNLLPQAFMAIGGVVLLAIILFSCMSTPVHAYTDQQLANAIRKTEGVWTYGIKTAKCSTEVQCRQICLKTIKNNKKRFTKYGYRSHKDFVSFLGSRYAPIGAGNDPKGLNRNWVKNVKHFLNKANA
jgi:hypothetical protein